MEDAHEEMNPSYNDQLPATEQTGFYYWVDCTSLQLASCFDSHLGWQSPSQPALILYSNLSAQKTKIKI